MSLKDFLQGKMLLDQQQVLSQRQSWRDELAALEADLERASQYIILDEQGVEFVKQREARVEWLKRNLQTH